MRVKKTRTVLIVILIAHLSGFSPLSRARSSHFKFDMSEVRWHRVVFKSNNFLGTVLTKAILEEVPADAVEGILIASPQGAVLEPSGTKVFSVAINSTIEPLIGSDEILATWLWFTPRKASAFQRIRLRKGKEKWEKTYRWTENGVFRLRRKPNGAEEEEFSPERWTDIEKAYYPHDLARHNCESVSGPSALLYVASAAGLAIGDPPLELCVFGKKQLHHVQVRAEKYQRLKIDYLETSQQKSTRRNGKAEVLKISFTSRSLFLDQAKAESFSFLGLKGDFDIFIDKVSKIPLQVSGKIPGLGNVNIRIDEIELKK